MKTALWRGVGRGSVAAALAALLPLALAMPAQAAGPDAVDQSATLAFIPFSYQTGLMSYAQTFTAGVTGQVDRVSLQNDTAGGFAGFNVYLEQTDSQGHPDGHPITGKAATNPSLVNCCRQFHDYKFNPGVPVKAGARYAIVVQLLAGSFIWWDSGPFNIYTAGQELIGMPWMTTTHHDFLFKEWVVTNTNSAPVVAANAPGVSVPEGTAPSMTGSCSDPDGDAVTLTASSGTVTSACAAGTWSWSQPAGDEAPTSTVTITADDGHGLQSQTQFSVDVNAVAPTARILTDPISVPEGTAVPFTGGATSPSVTDNAAGFTLAWSVTINGLPYASGSGSAFTFTPKDDGAYDVTLRATDDGGMTGTTSMTVIATNVAPIASITGVTSSVPIVRTPNQSLAFKGTFTDVDAGDKYTLGWNFGDGGSALGASATHSYAVAGTYTVTFTVSDGEGGVGQATTKVTVETDQQALASIATFVQGLPGLNAGQKNSLIAKLNAAADSLSRGNDTAAGNQLNAFLNELEADASTGKVSPADAAALSSAAHAVQGSLGTFNRFLEWWPLEA